MRIELPARSPFSLHSVIRTILTTNTAWSGTIRMNAALVALYGDRLPNAPAMQAFPTPQRLAAAAFERWGQWKALVYWFWDWAP